MDQKQINEIKDAVNDRIDLILDEPLAAFIQLLVPAICVAVVFGANALGWFSGIFPNAGWGLLTAMSAALYGAVWLVTQYAAGELAAPASDDI